MSPNPPENLVAISTQKSAPGGPKKALFIRTFGCQMNEYDSSKMARVLADNYHMVTTPEQADLILVNTCSVRDKPEHKLYSVLGEYRDLKKERPGLMIGVGGCVAQQEGANIAARNKAVDFVVGTHNISLIPSLIKLRQNGAPPQVAINYRDEWEELPLGFTDDGPRRVSAFIAISRGCNKSCTYCIVPTTRGPEVSRAFEEILREVRISVHQGAREIVLLGQTVNSWGLDFTPRRKFTELLQAVSEIPGVDRIRFTSPHPQEIRSDFIELVTANPKICHHVHMPLQSGSDVILKAMNRNYRRDRYLKIIQDLRARVADMAITTDIIVGFPGETAADFEATLEVMREVRFASSYSFVFSPRPGTAAAQMPELISAEEKLERLYQLQALQDAHTTEYLESQVGKVVPVLLDGPSKMDPSKLQGRTPQNLQVNLREAAPDLSPGRTVVVRIAEKKRFSLIGELCEQGRAADVVGVAA